jgi:ParB family chromosome partitioning protein
MSTKITTLPLFALTLSRLNVRQTERDADVASLAEDIAARGLKQNLVVIPAHFSTAETEENFGNKFEVIAGGRRYQAMQLLVDQGRLPHDHPVPVLVETRDDASETSLSENLHRVAMNPADEFAAFDTVVQQQLKLGSDHEAAVLYTSRRFGVSVRHVEGRLRLASLAPEILDALRDGTIGLESAKAYAGSADHDLQRKVFAAQAKSNWKPHDPATVRQNLRGETFPLGHPLMKFVGLDAYRAGGGRTEVEMFMGSEGEERGLDMKLLEKLAKAQAEPLVAPQAKSDGYKSGLLATSGYGYTARLPKAPEGMVRHERYYGELAKTAKKKAIGVYAIRQDGTGIEHVATFKTEPKEKPGAVRDWDAEHRARQRQWEIEKRAARLAVGSMAGTPLEGRAFWPEYNVNPVASDRDDDNHSLVAILIRVPTAEIEAKMAEAEKALAEQEAAAAAQQDAATAAPSTIEKDADDVDGKDHADEPGEFDEEEAA